MSDSAESERFIQTKVVERNPHAALQRDKSIDLGIHAYPVTLNIGDSLLFGDVAYKVYFRHVSSMEQIAKGAPPVVVFVRKDSRLHEG